MKQNIQMLYQCGSIRHESIPICQNSHFMASLLKLRIPVCEDLAQIHFLPVQHRNALRLDLQRGAGLMNLERAGDRRFTCLKQSSENLCGAIRVQPIEQPMVQFNGDAHFIVTDQDVCLHSWLILLDCFLQSGLETFKSACQTLLIVIQQVVPGCGSHLASTASSA